MKYLECSTCGAIYSADFPPRDSRCKNCDNFLVNKDDSLDLDLINDANFQIVKADVNEHLNRINLLEEEHEKIIPMVSQLKVAVRLLNKINKKLGISLDEWLEEKVNGDPELKEPEISIDDYPYELIHDACGAAFIYSKVQLNDGEKIKAEGLIWSDGRECNDGNSFVCTVCGEPIDKTSCRERQKNV